MSKEDLVFPVEPVVRVKDPSTLEFPEVPRAHTEGVKHDLVFPEGEEAREAKKPVRRRASSKPKSHTPVASPPVGYSRFAL